jgi:serine/threonine protein kinase/ribosomal protein L40E
MAVEDLPDLTLHEQETDKSLICTRCNASNSSAARFCNTCGVTLSPLSAPGAEASVPSSEDRNRPEGQQDPLVGRVIEGKYRIDSLIGAGGMGSVYQATRLLIGDEVAIKILHTERVVDPHAAERFRREAQAAARLKHPSAVSIYDFGVSRDGLQYLVMEMIEGRSLREVARDGPLNAAFAAAVTSQVCAALDEAHRRHIVHRDIKPDNIILNSTPTGLRVKVLDFGIAKLRDDTASHLTQTGSVMGTPHYMSPEQCLGEELDNRADVYSVGVVLYEMLCGRVPFNSPISTAVVVQHVNQPPPLLRSINAAVSPQMEAAVLHALEKSRGARPQSAGAFAREVMAALGAVAANLEDWPSETAQPVQYPIVEDESTVERKQAAPLALQGGKELAPTVHLASLSGARAPVIAGSLTAGSGAVSAATVKRNVARNYAIVVIATLLCVSLIGIIGWRLSQSGTANTNSSSSAQLNQEEPATNPTTGIANTRNRGNLAPPPGMLYVSGGTFVMGSDEELSTSTPAHTASLKPFFIDAYEVTCEQYKKCVDANQCAPPSTWANGNYPTGDERHPVTGVSWDDAETYAGWVGKRLPTEEEWEFAARGPKSLKYPWGNSWKPGCANADKEGEARRGMTEVGSYQCDSPSGAKDMIGNAWEWTSSDWKLYLGKRFGQAEQTGQKVIRGGTWDTASKFATGALRAPLMGAGDKTRYERTGFRCAKDVAQ